MRAPSTPPSPHRPRGAGATSWRCCDTRRPPWAPSRSRNGSVCPNTVRFHLDHLVQTGQVEKVPVPPAGRGRPKLAYRLRRSMDPAGPRNYRLLAEVLAEGLGNADAVEQVADAGRRWGGLLVDPTVALPAPTAGAAVDRLVNLLDDLGFAPERPPAHGPLTFSQ